MQQHSDRLRSASGVVTGETDAEDAAGGAGVPSLQQVCMTAAEAQLRADTVCDILGLADVVRPSADQLRAAAIAWLAAHLPAVLAADPSGLQDLSFDCMLDLLQHSALVCLRPALLLVLVCTYRLALLHSAVPPHKIITAKSCRSISSSRMRRFHLANCMTATERGTSSGMPELTFLGEIAGV